MIYKLITFGGVSLLKGDQPVSGLLLQRSRLALLGVLATAGPRGVPRDKLVELFWPESDGERARASLNQSLYSTRRQIGRDDVIVGAADLRVNPAVLTSDVSEFQAAVADGNWAAAAQLYSGPFLDAIHVRGSTEFDRWCSAQRARFEADFVRAVEALAVAAETEGDDVAAARWWKRLAVHDLLNGRYTAAAIRSLARSGDHAAAIGQYKAHETGLAQDLDATPESSVVAALREAEASGRSKRPAKISVREELPEIRDEAGVETIEPSDLQTDESHSGKRRRRLRLAFLATAVVIVAVGSAAYRNAASPPGNDLMRQLVAIGDFENGTGDSSWNTFSRVLSESIRSGIAQTGLVPVIDASTGRSGKPQIPELAGVTKPLDASILITGAYYLLKDSLEIHVRLLDPKSNRVLSAIRPVTVASTDQRTALSLILERVAGALAQRIDDRLATISPGSSPPEYAAYLDYVEGLERWQDSKRPEASRLFESAFEKDTSFVAALLWASITGRSGAERMAQLGRLESFRARLAPVDRHGLDFLLASRDSTPDHTERSLAAARRAAALAPQSHWAWNVAFALRLLGRYDEAADALLALDPTRGWLRGAPQYWTMLGENLHLAHRYSEQREMLTRGFGIHGSGSPRTQQLVLGLVTASAALRDTAGLQKWLGVLTTLETPVIPEAARWDLALAGDELQFHGYAAHAADIRRYALSRSVRASQTEKTKAGTAEWETAQQFRGRMLASLGQYRLAINTIDTLVSHLAALRKENPKEAPGKLIAALGWRGVFRARARDTAGVAASLDDLEAIGQTGFSENPWYWESAIKAAHGQPGASALVLERARSLGIWPGYMTHDAFVTFLPGSNHPEMSKVFRESGRPGP